MMHVHHLIPKHMGGSDEPHNLLSCTVEEHALLHKRLWKKHGYEWDRVAWLSLSGQINISEAKRLVQKEAFRKAGDVSRANRNLNGTSIGDWNRRTGHVKGIATLDGMKKGGSKTGRMLVETGRFDEIRLAGSIAGGKAAAKVLNSTRCKCVECGFESHAGGVGNHQKRTGHKGKEQVCQQ